MQMIESRKAMRGQGGFTLIELLVVVAILAILADFLMGQIQLWTIPRGVNPLR